MAVLPVRGAGGGGGGGGGGGAGGGGGGGGGGGSGGMPPSEIASGAFFKPFVSFKWHDEMTIFLVLIRPIDQVTLVLIRHLGVIGG